MVSLKAKAPADVYRSLTEILEEKGVMAVGRNLDNIALSVWLKMQELNTDVRAAYRHVMMIRAWTDDDLGNHL